MKTLIFTVVGLFLVSQWAKADFSPYRGVNVQTASYTLTANDLGKLVVMNCSSACAVTLSGSPANGFYGAIESIGSTLATVSLNSKQFNGATTVPVLNSFRPIQFWSNGTNYFGKAPDVAGSNITLTSASNGLTIASTGGTNVHSVGVVFDGQGSSLVSGKSVYFIVPYACTIQAWNMTVDTGTATIDVWKIASGTAIPTISNAITASATPAISTGTAIHSTTLTGWTTSVSANDIFGFNLKTVSSATQASLILQCQ